MSSTTTTTTTDATLEQPQQAILKLRNNPLDTEKTLLIEALTRKITAGAGSYGDWRDDLLRDGYVVVKGAFPREKAENYYRAKIFEWLGQVSPEIDINDKSTWDNDKMPDHSGHGVISRYGVPHEKFFWDLRQEPGIIDIFSKFYGTDELIVSFDAINIAFPGMESGERRILKAGWQHIDQSPYRNGLCCVQGIAQCSTSGPKDGSLVVYKGSHLLTERFFNEVYTKDIWPTKDVCLLTEEHLKWFADNGAEYHKVQAEPGDFILWDSRTIHWGAAPENDAENIRTIAYICYTPAEWAAEDQLVKKRNAFESFSSTTHWPHDNINTRVGKAKLANGKDDDPKDLGRPRELPEINDTVLKLAGMKSY